MQSGVGGRPTAGAAPRASRSPPWAAPRGVSLAAAFRCALRAHSDWRADSHGAPIPRAHGRWGAPFPLLRLPCSLRSHPPRVWRASGERCPPTAGVFVGWRVTVKRAMFAIASWALFRGGGLWRRALYALLPRGSYVAMASSTPPARSARPKGSMAKGFTQGRRLAQHYCAERAL